MLSPPEVVLLGLALAVVPLHGIAPYGLPSGSARYAELHELSARALLARVTPRRRLGPGSASAVQVIATVALVLLAAVEWVRGGLPQLLALAVAVGAGLASAAWRRRAAGTIRRGARARGLTPLPRLLSATRTRHQRALAVLALVTVLAGISTYAHGAGSAPVVARVLVVAVLALAVGLAWTVAWRYDDEVEG